MAHRPDLAFGCWSQPHELALTPHTACGAQAELGGAYHREGQFRKHAECGALMDLLCMLTLRPVWMEPARTRTSVKGWFSRVLHAAHAPC